MLQDIAVQYGNLMEGELRLIHYGIFILGAAIAGVLSRGKTELRRAPYFVFSGLLLLAAVATQSVWLGTLPAMAGGYLWVFMGIDVVVSLVVGYFVGVIAMARARDGFGHGRYAALAFIPLANLALLFKGSKNQISHHRIRTIPLISGKLGVLVGFVILAAVIAVSTLIKTEIDRAAMRASLDPDFQAMRMESMIRSQGLEATLGQAAAEVDVPQIMDEVTTLFLVDSDVTTLRYHYVVSNGRWVVTDIFRSLLTLRNCTYLLVQPVLQADGAIEHIYYTMEGNEIGAVLVTLDQCG